VAGRRWVGALLLLAALAACVAAAPGVSSVASQLHPPDCASNQSAADCPTEMAAQFRAQIASDLRRGQSPQQIVAEFEQQYGPAVLALPTGGGLGTLAWWLPPVVLVIGAGVASVLIRAWRRRGGAGRPATAEPDGPGDGGPGRGPDPEIPAEVRARM
jgi:cytochrome c-type biogenesis protein CcmH/NrfF